MSRGNLHLRIKEKKHKEGESTAEDTECAEERRELKTEKQRYNDEDKTRLSLSLSKDRERDRNSYLSIPSRTCTFTRTSRRITPRII